MSANVGLGIKLAPWLNFKSTYGYRGSFNKNSYHTPFVYSFHSGQGAVS